MHGFASRLFVISFALIIASNSLLFAATPTQASDKKLLLTTKAGCMSCHQGESTLEENDDNLDSLADVSTPS